MARPRAVRRRPTGRFARARARAGAVAVLLAVLVWAVTRTYPNYDSYYHLVWGRRAAGRHARRPSRPTRRRPQHPLYVALGARARARLRRGRRPRARARAACSRTRRWSSATYRLGAARLRALERRAGGAVRRRERVVPALRRARLRRRAVPRAGGLGGRARGRGRAAAAAPRRRRCSSLAGLLRPEAWVLAGLSWLWAWRRATAAARLLLAAGRRRGRPLIWALVDLVVTGDPLHSLHATSELADDLGRVRGLRHVPGSFVSFVGATVRPPVALLAPGRRACSRGGCSGWRALRVPLALFAAGVITFVGTGVARPLDPPALPDGPGRRAVPVRRLRAGRASRARAGRPAAAPLGARARPPRRVRRRRRARDPRAVAGQRARGAALHPRAPTTPRRAARRPGGPRGACAAGR